MRRIRVSAVLGNLLADEERTANFVIVGCAVAVVACFTVAVLAMAFMK